MAVGQYPRSTQTDTAYSGRSLLVPPISTSSMTTPLTPCGMLTAYAVPMYRTRVCVSVTSFALTKNEPFTLRLLITASSLAQHRYGQRLQPSRTVRASRHRRNGWLYKRRCDEPAQVHVLGIGRRDTGTQPKIPVVGRFLLQGAYNRRDDGAVRSEESQLAVTGDG